MAQDSPKKNSTAKWIVIHIPELIASVALVFAITLTVINVFTRYCLHFTIKGSDEYVCIAFAWMVFPGTAAAYRRHMHYGVDLLVNAFPHKVRCIVDVVVQLIITVIMAICTYLTWILIQHDGHPHFLPCAGQRDAGGLCPDDDLRRCVSGAGRPLPARETQGRGADGMNINIWLPLLCIVALAMFNVPIWLALLGGALPYFLILQPTLPVQIAVQRVVAVTETSSYLAIPFFITAGAIMNYAGISSRLLDLADGLVGHLTGGLGHVNILLSVLMGGVSGSAAADASMEAKILVPEMLKRGYDEEFSAAITIASSLITPIIPPGMGLIVFSFATQISVGRMFAAGYVPGLLCMVFMMIYVYIVSKKHGYKGSRDKMASPRELLHLLRQAFWAMLIPFGILLGLRGGMFTATEAGAICAWYSLFIGVVIYKEIKWSHIWTILKESVLGTATVMILICAAGALSYFMTYERVPQALAETMLSMNLTKVSFILMTNVILLIIGMFMEGGPAQIILGPLLMPIAIQLGIDPIQFGIMFVFNLGIGNMSPPFGIVLYQVSGLMGLKFTKVAKACMPFIVIMLLVLAIIAFCPKLILFLPNLLYGA